MLGDVLTKARLNLDVMDRLDMVGRTSEMARVFGIDFYSVGVCVFFFPFHFFPSKMKCHGECGARHLSFGLI